MRISQKMKGVIMQNLSYIKFYVKSSILQYLHISISVLLSATHKNF